MRTMEKRKKRISSEETKIKIQGNEKILNIINYKRN